MSNPIKARRFETREEALAAIESAATWPELFDHVGTAFLSPRETWGDEARQINAAMVAWASASFVVAAGERVEFGEPGKARWVNGPDLVAASFLSAKSLAKALTGPMKLVGNERHNQPRLVAQLGWVPSWGFNLALGNVMCDANELGDALLAKGGAAQGQPWPLGRDNVRGLIGPTVLCGMSSWHLEKEDSHEWNSSRVVDDHGLGGAGKQQMSAMERDGLAAFESLRVHGGFRYISTGTMGGWKNAIECARAMESCCESLAAAIGMQGEPVAGLGSLALAVNVYQTRSIASFGADFFTIKTGPRASSFGHEWTHALDHASKFWEMAKETRLLALNAAHTAPRDLAVFSRLVRAMAYAKKVPELRLSKDVAGRLGQDISEPVVERALADILAAGSHKEGKGTKMVAKALAKARMEEALSAGANEPSRREGTELFQFARLVRKAMCQNEQAMDKLVAGGASAYAVGGVVLDMVDSRVAGRRYWAQESEQLARIGEGFFAARSSDLALLSPSSGDDEPWPDNGRSALWRFVDPMGEERIHGQKLFKAWLDSCAPYLRAAPGAPKDNAETEVDAEQPTKASKAAFANASSPFTS
jgi:hypothetical protein